MNIKDTVVSIIPLCFIKDTNTRPQSITLGELFGSHRTGEKDGDGYIPAIPHTVGGPRDDANVAAITLAVFDVDHIAPAQYREIRESLAVAHVEHSTYRHTPDAPRFRIAFPLSRPLLAPEWPTVRSWVNANLLGGLADPSTSNLSRSYYTPACPEGSTGEIRFNDGDPLPVDEILAIAPPVALNVSSSGANAPPRKATGLTEEEAQECMRGFLAARVAENRADKAEGVELARRALAGEALAEKGGRDIAILSLAGFMGFKDPDTDPEVLAEVIAESLEATENVAPVTVPALESAIAKIGKAQAKARVERTLNDPDWNARFEAFVDLPGQKARVEAYYRAEAEKEEAREREQEALRALGEAKALPKRIEEVLRSDAFNKPQATFPTAYPELNALIAGGLKSRQVMVIAGPTGAGKTGFATCLARDLRAHLPVLFVCTEIDEAEQAARFAAIELGQKPDDILSQRVTVDVAAASVKDWPVYVYNLDWFSTDGLDAIAERVEAIKKATDTAPAVVIDYLQMVASEDPDARRLSVSAVANKLRMLAQVHDIPVVAVSSVSRAFYGQNRKAMAEEEDPRAWLASAKESGDVEYAAAVFAFLDVGDTVDPEYNRPARLIVAKSRRGQVGFVGLKFHGPSGRFSADMGAAINMSAKVKAQGRSLEKEAKQDETVMAILRKNGGSLPKSELVQMYGARKADAYCAIKRLIGARRIAESQQEGKRGKMIDHISVTD